MEIIKVSHKKRKTWGYFCLECNKEVKILFNDEKFSFLQHRKEHLSTEDEPSTSSGTRKSCDDKTETDSFESNSTSDNKHVICEKQLRFKCNVCDVCIFCDTKEETLLLKNIERHFTSETHRRSVDAIDVLNRFNAIDIANEENYDFISSYGNVYCKICACYVEGTTGRLEDHIKLHSSCSNTNTTATDPDNVSKQADKSEGSLAKSKNDRWKDLLDSLPERFRNVDFISLNSKGDLTCLSCKCMIPLSKGNVIAHLYGNHINFETRQEKPEEM